MLNKTKFKTEITQLAFIIVFSFSCLTTHSNVINFYGGIKVPILLKLLLIIMSVGILSFVNRNNENTISKYPPIIVNATLTILIFDFYITNLSGTILLYKIWWLASIFVAEATLFLIITLFEVDYYDRFYIRFWKGFTPTFLYTFIYCFIRKPYRCERTINYIPFKRGFKYLIQFLKNPTGTFENPLYFFGNIIFFIPLAFIIRSFFPKLKNYQIMIIGFIIPIVIETYQFIFSCGDVDIDDLILNWIGFGLGMLIESKIKNKLLHNS